MITHTTRLLVITFALFASVLGLIGVSTWGDPEGTTFGVLIGLVSTLAPAFFDALEVKRHGLALTGSAAPSQDSIVLVGRPGPDFAEVVEDELLNDRK